MARGTLIEGTCALCRDLLSMKAITVALDPKFQLRFLDVWRPDITFSLGK